MIVAEELDAQWSDVRVEQARIEQGCVWRPVRRRLAFGAVELGCFAPRRRARPRDVGDCRRRPVGRRRTRLSHAEQTVIHAASGRSVSYFEIANDAAKLPLPDVATIPSEAAQRISSARNARIPGVDNLAIVTGAPLFGIDQVLPGMRYAVYQKCPAMGGSVIDANLDEIRKLPGVLDAFVLKGNGKVAELMPGVAIVAKSTWSAISAKRRLKVTWNEATAAKDSWTATLRALPSSSRRAARTSSRTRAQSMQPSMRRKRLSRACTGMRSSRTHNSNRRTARRGFTTARSNCGRRRKRRSGALRMSPRRWRFRRRRSRCTRRVAGAALDGASATTTWPKPPRSRSAPVRRSSCSGRVRTTWRTTSIVPAGFMRSKARSTSGQTFRVAASLHHVLQ